MSVRILTSLCFLVTVSILSSPSLASVPIGLPPSTVAEQQESDGEWMPSERVRNRVKSLSTDDIAYIEFSGDRMVDIDGDDYLKITDPKIIDIFMNALHHATYWRKDHPSEVDGLAKFGPAEGDGEIKLYLRGHVYFQQSPDKPLEGERPLVFPFFPWKDLHMYYGPEFYDGLLALQKYQMNHVHEEVKRLGSQVVAIQLSDDPVVFVRDFPPKVTKPSEIEEVLRSLRQSDERIYDPTFEEVNNPICQLQLRDGSRVNLCIIIPGLDKSDYYDPPWLMRLWKYLKRPTLGEPRKAASDE